MSVTIQPVTWPPKVGRRIHWFYNAKNINNKSASVRAVVDDKVCICRLWRGNHYGWLYFVLSRVELEVCNCADKRQPVIRYGSLPKSAR